MIGRIRLFVVMLLVFGMVSCVGNPVLYPVNIKNIKIASSKVIKMPPIMSMIRTTVKVNKGGSGVVIWKTNKETWVLTAWHVVSNLIGTPNFLLGGISYADIKPVPIEIHLMSPKGKDLKTLKYIGSIDASSKYDDLALIKISAKLPCAVTSLAKIEPKFGDPVWLVGHPLGRFIYTITFGIVSHPKRIYNGKDYLQIDAGMIFGNSGGPVFNQRGELIGIADAIFFVKGPTHIGIAVSLSRIRKFLHNSQRAPFTKVK